MYNIASAPAGKGYEVIGMVTSGADGVPFGRIGGAAGFADGGFVLYESSFCRLHTFSASLQPEQSFAGCGDGPTELRIGTKVLTAGDTVVVIDTRRRRMVRYTRGGEFIDGQAVQLPAEGPTDFQEVGGLRGTTVFASFTSPLEPAESAPPVDSTGPLLGGFDLLTGAIGPVAVVGHPAVASTSGWSGLMGYPMCASPDRTSLVMLNRWAHEAAIFAATDLAPQRVVSTPELWPAFVLPKDAKVASPSAFVLGVACGQQEFIAGQFRLDPENIRGLPLEGWMAAWQYDGTLLAVDHLTQADSVLFGIPAGMAGDRLIIRNNTGLDAPALVVARRRSAE